MLGYRFVDSWYFGTQRPMGSGIFNQMNGWFLMVNVEQWSMKFPRYIHPRQDSSTFRCNTTKQQLSYEKNPYYFPLNPGCLIGIPAINPPITKASCLPPIQPKQPRALSSLLNGRRIKRPPKPSYLFDAQTDLLGGLILLRIERFGIFHESITGWT